MEISRDILLGVLLVVGVIALLYAVKKLFNGKSSVKTETALDGTRVETVNVEKYDRKYKIKALISLVISVVAFMLAGMIVYFAENFASYEFGAYPDEERYYLALNLDEEGNIEYIIPEDFSLEKTKVDINSAIIAGKIDTLGFNNHYKKYVDFGGIKVVWDTYEDIFIMSKYNAIRFGLMEATGAADEEKFDIATTPEEAEELQNKMDGLKAEQSAGAATDSEADMTDKVETESTESSEGKN